MAITMKGIKIKNLDQLRENFDFTNAKDYLLQGTLAAWMREQSENELADELDNLNADEFSNQDLKDFFCSKLNIQPEQCLIPEDDKELLETESNDMPPGKSVSCAFSELSDAQVESIREKLGKHLEKINKTVLSWHPAVELANKTYWDSLSPAEQKQGERLSYVISLFKGKEEDAVNHSNREFVNTVAFLADKFGLGENVYKFSKHEITAESHLQSDLGFTKEEQELRFEKIRRKYHVVLDDLSSDPTIEDVCIALEADLFSSDPSRHRKPTLDEETTKQILRDLKTAQIMPSLSLFSSSPRMKRLSNMLLCIQRDLPQPTLVIPVIDLHKRLISGYGLLPEEVNSILDKLKDEYQVDLLTLSADPDAQEICLAVETELEQ